MYHSKFFAPLCLAILFSTALSANEKITAKVGGYEFPPFVEKDGSVGIVSEFIKKMDGSQEKFHFILVETSANRRYRDLEDKKYDLIFFEDEAWSWGKSKLLISSKRDQTYNFRILLNKSSSISAQEIESLTLANLK